MTTKKSTLFKERITYLFNRRKSYCIQHGERFTRELYAERIGATIGMLKGWLLGSGEPNTETLIHIAKVENVTVDWLVGASDEERPVTLVASKAGLMSKISSADSETLAQLEQFYDYLEYQKKQGKSAANDK